MVRRRQLWTFQVLLGLEVPEPILARLVALDDPVPGVGSVVAGVLLWRVVAAADVAAKGAPAQVKPPSTRLEALDTTVAAGRHLRMNLAS
jgi:hypothetical protein